MTVRNCRPRFVKGKGLVLKRHQASINNEADVTQPEGKWQVGWRVRLVVQLDAISIIFRV